MCKKLLSLLFCLMLLVGCGSAESFSDTYTINIPTSSMHYIQIEWPSDLSLKLTDNATFWQFEDDSYIYTSDSTEVSTTEDGKYVVSKKSGNRHIIYTGSKNYTKVFNAAITNGVLYNNTIKLPENVELNCLPDYTRVDVTIDDVGMAMPESVVNDIRSIPSYYSASSFLENPNRYIEAFILDRNMDDLKQELFNMVTSGDKITHWYYNKDNGIYYLTSGNKVAVAKEIRDCEWYCMLGTYDFINEMLSVIDLVDYAD